jgi:hypothetical protein
MSSFQTASERGEAKPIYGCGDNDSFQERFQMASLTKSKEEVQKQVEEFNKAVYNRLDAWVPACGGTEVPFRSRSGATLLYCFNPRLGKHAYINLETDMILEDEEAFAHLNK